MKYDPTNLRNVPDHWIRGLAYGDTHCPYLRTGAEDFLISCIKDWRPKQIIHGGDGIEATFASRWPTELKKTAADEYRALNAHLMRVAKALDGTELFFLPGNHDDNVIAPHRLDEKLRELVDWRKHELLRPAFERWNVPTVYEYSKRGCLTLGQVTIAHGYECSSVSDRNQAIRLGKPYGLFISGHTHRPNPVTRARITQDVSIPYWYANWGTLGPLKPEYVSRQFTDAWGAGVVLFAYDPKVTIHKAYDIHWKAQLLSYE